MTDEAWISEASYQELSVCARWLHRTPPPVEAQPNVPAAPLPLAYADAAEAEAGACVRQHSQLTWEEHLWFLRSRAPEAAARLSPDEAARMGRLEGVVAAEQAAFRAQRAADADVAALRCYHPRVAEQARRSACYACLP